MVIKSEKKTKIKGQRHRGSKAQRTSIEHRASSIEHRTSGFAENDILNTQKEAAEFIGASTRTVRRYVLDGMPRTADGKYIKSMLTFFKENKGHKQTETRTRAETAEADFKTAKAQLTQLELEIKQGQWVRADEINKKNVAKVLALKRQLLSLGRKLAPRISRLRDITKIQKIIDEEVKEMIKGFAK